jgi:hypothetical protein
VLPSRIKTTPYCNSHSHLIIYSCIPHHLSELHILLNIIQLAANRIENLPSNQTLIVQRSTEINLEITEPETNIVISNTTKFNDEHMINVRISKM